MSTYIENDVIRIVQHPGQGFFSCCTIHLQRILTFFNTFHKLPLRVDSTEQFVFYKTPQNFTTDIKPLYFDDSITTDIVYQGKEIKVTDLETEEQYSDFNCLNYADLFPFLTRYFSPASEIISIIESIEHKYQIDYQNTCVLFFRGNDKECEMVLPTYTKYIRTAKQMLETNPDIRFLVQSDETEFLEKMTATFPNSVVFYDEIRHMRKMMSTVDKIFKSKNADMSLLYLAITYIMSRCKYVIFNSGNCSLWIALFRGHSDGITQLMG